MALRLTEQPSKYDHLEKKSVAELLRDINEEDKSVPLAIEKVLPDLEKLVSAIEHQLKNGGRMFYCGCGTGGRLSVLDAVELPNTYGIDPEMIQCVLAGGVENLVLALEEKEDDIEEGWRTLTEQKHVTPKDIVVGISASGTTPYVLQTLKHCKEHGIPTGSFVNNPDSPISKYSDYPVEVVTGPEFITGSTRMKAGTSQKLICDMISSTVLIRLGRIEGNQMVNVRLINDKVVDRSVRMLMERNPSLKDYEYCKEMIKKCGNVKKTEAYLLKEGVLKTLPIEI
jgi:N-acetylmuramic acid 6-phosphate etherase